MRSGAVVRAAGPRAARPSYAQPVIFWGLADSEVNEIIDVFADRKDAEQMLRDCLSDEPEWVDILEVVPVKFEFSAN
jgi:hypothetical protein